MPTYVCAPTGPTRGSWASTFPMSGSFFAHDAEIRKHAGVELKEVYWTQGTYDLVCVMEAPRRRELAAPMLGVAALGNTRTTTLRAFDREEFEGIRANVADQG
jgi:uncharacterized protein with GYD domain